MKDQYAVETINLTRRFDNKTAVDHLNLAVAEGEFFGFLGPNGAGKSTTIHMLVGLLRPTEGTARIAGIDIWQEPLAAKRHLGVVPEGAKPIPTFVRPRIYPLCRNNVWCTPG